MRLRRAEPLAGLGGVLLFVSLFLTWYTAVVPEPEPGSLTLLETFSGSGSDTTAWQWFTVIDVLLALLALLAIAVPVASLTSRGPATSIGTAVIASALGWIAVLLVAYRLVNPPGPNEFIARGAGAWLALAAALIAWVGSWLSMRDESTPGATPPDVPRRPAPPATAA